ncbi:MAG: sodium:solute symporter family protein [Bacteroidota bacterium]
MKNWLNTRSVPNKKLPIRAFIPTGIMAGVMLSLGLFLYLFADTEIFWEGFLSMLFFYCIIFFIGSYVAARKSGKGTEEDVMLAGRSIPLWIAIFTMSATWIGGGYINGAAEATFSSGLVWVQAPWGYAISLIIGGLFFAKKMRRYQFRTMLDPLAQRFGEKTASLFFFPALAGEIFWTAALLSALGSTFGLIMGLDFQSSIILSAVIAIAYTALGGLWAVALTDIVQMILLFLGLFLTLPFAFDFVGGWDHAWATYQENFGAAASIFPSREALGSSYWNWWDYAFLLIFGGIPWQVYFQRVLSAKDENTARNLSIIAGLVCLIAAIPPIMIGVIGSVADWSSIGGIPENSLEILPSIMKSMTPTLVATIGLGAVAAAVMSSTDSSILSSSSMASWNVYRPLFNPSISSEQLAKVIKSCIWIIGIAATLIALQIKSIYALWYLCSDFVYCLLFPALVCALFDPKANRIGAIAGLGVAAILRFGGGDATLGIPTFIDYPMIDPAEEMLNGLRTTVLFPFRTLAMCSGLLTSLLVSRVSQRHSQPLPLRRMEE